MEQTFSVYMIKTLETQLVASGLKTLESAKSWAIDYIVQVRGSVKIETHDSPRGILLKSPQFGESYLITNQKLEKRTWQGR